MIPLLPLRRTAPLFLAGLLALAAAPLAAQDTTGVRLELRYQPEYQPGLVVLPFAAPAQLARAAAEVREVVRQDLAFSDRFEVRDAGPDARAGAPIDAEYWRGRGADWVVQGEVRPRGDGLVLEAAIYDAVYGQERERRTVGLPDPGDAGFRMAVHAVSDALVLAATGEPGMAASRVAFTLKRGDAKEIWTVDSDGESLRQVTRDGSIALSPAWSPDGRRLAFTSFRGGRPWIYERDLASGSDRVVSDRSGLNITPAYSPDGGTLAFGTTVGTETEVATFDLERRCCLRQHTRGGTSASLSPTWSPDGRRFAFVSDRLGEPKIYVMEPGGEPRLLSEYRYGARGFDASPDWSPTGRRIAYHTRIRGVFQIAVLDEDGRGGRLLTDRGRNEDPSWAPDGRHLVFAGDGPRGTGLFVLDTVSGRVRPLLTGREAGLPDWSPPLARLGAAPSR